MPSNQYVSTTNTHSTHSAKACEVGDEKSRTEVPHAACWNVKAPTWAKMPEPVGEPTEPAIDASKYVIEGICSEGDVVVVAGGSGVGKTQLATAIEESVSHGSPLLRCATAKGGRIVIVLNFEDDIEYLDGLRWYIRKRSGHSTNGKPVFQITFTESDSPSREKERSGAGPFTFDDLVEYMGAIIGHVLARGERAPLVIFDNFRAAELLFAKTSDGSTSENTVGCVGSILDKLRPWREQGSGILLLHHFNRSGAYAGSSALESTPTCTLALDKIDTYAYADLKPSYTLDDDVLAEIFCSNVADELEYREDPDARTVWGTETNVWPDEHMHRSPGDPIRAAESIPALYRPDGGDITAWRLQVVKSPRKFGRFRSFDFLACSYNGTDEQSSGDGTLFVRDKGALSHFPTFALEARRDPEAKVIKNGLRTKVKQHQSISKKSGKKSKKPNMDAVLACIALEMADKDGEPIPLESADATALHGARAVEEAVRASEGLYVLEKTASGIVIKKGE